MPEFFWLSVTSFAKILLTQLLPPSHTSFPNQPKICTLSVVAKLVQHVPPSPSPIFF